MCSLNCFFFFCVQTYLIESQTFKKVPGIIITRSSCFLHRYSHSEGCHESGLIARNETRAFLAAKTRLLRAIPSKTFDFADASSS